MESLLVALFIGGYALIALEHRLHIDKAATAILIGTLSWLLLFIMPLPSHRSSLPHVENALLHHLTEAAGILFFLLGAMTIVEVVDSYEGFQYVLRVLRVKSMEMFLVLLVTLTFFLSAVIDNLTTTLLMVSLLQKVISPTQRSVRLLGASLIVLAANSGGAWSPLGDVTTTMLWIKERITEVNIIKRTLLPSITSVVIPYFLIVRQLGRITLSLEEVTASSEGIPPRISLAVFLIGIGGILSVPLMKILFRIPPFLAMLFALGLVWIVTEIFYRRLSGSVEEPVRLRIVAALERIDTPSLLFFLGILLAIGALSEIGVLRWAAHALDQIVGNMDIVVFLFGILSSIVDNVPLVAAAIEMYPLSQFPTDHRIWEFLAYTAGVGGNILIIGSAAGVVAMGMEKIEFFWYLRRVSWIAFLGYAAGAAVYLLLA